MVDTNHHRPVIPAEPGIQRRYWVLAVARTTRFFPIASTKPCSMVVMTGLMTEGFKSPAPCQSWTATSPTRGRPELAGHRHQDQVGPLALIRLAGDDHSRPLLGLSLIGEGNGTSTTSPKR